MVPTASSKTSKFCVPTLTTLTCVLLLVLVVSVESLSGFLQADKLNVNKLKATHAVIFTLLHVRFLYRYSVI